MGFIAKIFGTKNDRELKPLMARALAIGTWEERVKGLSDSRISARILELKVEIEKAVKAQKAPKLQKGEDLTREEMNLLLDPYLNEVFALTREAGKRVMGMRHYDVQLVGGMVLHSGKVAENGKLGPSALQDDLCIALQLAVFWSTYVVQRKCKFLDYTRLF